MVLPRVIHIAQYRVVEIQRALLIVGGRQQLDHIPPKSLVLGLVECLSAIVQRAYRIPQIFNAAGEKMLMAEIIQREFLGVNLVHGARGVRGGADLVLVCLFPPIQGRVHVTRYVDHPHKLAVIATSLCELRHQRKVFLSNHHAISRYACFPQGVAQSPRIHGVSRPSNGCCPTGYLGHTNLNHVLPPLTFHRRNPAEIRLS